MATVQPSKSSTQPVMAAGLLGIKAIAARYMNVVALKNDGTVWDWGSNHFRQLGNTRISSEDSTRPVRAGTLTDVVGIAAGRSHTAAVSAKGVVWTWGQNDRGALGAEPEALDQSDTPMRPGQPVPPPCTALFSCLTDAGRVIEICGDQDSSDVGKWSNIHYRFGPAHGIPDLMFPPDPDQAPSSLFFSEGVREGEVRNSIRFSTGAFTYRVYYVFDSGAGVEVQDGKGKTSTIQCAERPEVYDAYMRENLPCDPKNPRGCEKGQPVR